MSIELHPRPKSRGSVTLRSADPRQPPKVDFNYFADERDVKVLTEGLKMAVDFAYTRAFKEKGVEVFGPDKPMCGKFLTSDKIPDGYTQEYFECCAREVIDRAGLRSLGWGSLLSTYEFL